MTNFDQKCVAVDIYDDDEALEGGRRCRYKVFSSVSLGDCSWKEDWQYFTDLVHMERCLQQSNQIMVVLMSILLSCR